MTWISLLASAAAVALLVLLNRGLMGGRTNEIASLDVARARLAADNAGFDFDGDGLLADDRKTAFLSSADADRLGLVLVHGDSLVTRTLTPGAIEVRETAEDHRTGLILSTGDLVLGEVGVMIADRDARSRWHRRLTGETSRSAGPLGRYRRNGPA